MSVAVSEPANPTTGSGFSGDISRPRCLLGRSRTRPQYEATEQRGGKLLAEVVEQAPRPKQKRLLAQPVCSTFAIRDIADRSAISAAFLPNGVVRAFDHSQIVLAELVEPVRA
jgi:hypothetical protein